MNRLPNFQTFLAESMKPRLRMQGIQTPEIDPEPEAPEAPVFRFEWFHIRYGDGATLPLVAERRTRCSVSQMISQCLALSPGEMMLFGPGLSVQKGFAGQLLICKPNGSFTWTPDAETRPETHQKVAELIGSILDRVKL